MQVWPSTSRTASTRQRDAVDLALVEGDVDLLVGLVVVVAEDVPMTIADEHDERERERRRTQPRLEGGLAIGHGLGGEDSNLQQPAPKAGVLPVELPPIGHGSGYGVGLFTLRPFDPSGAPARTPCGAVGAYDRPVRHDATILALRKGAGSVAPLMGSLIKKRRKRMRKKKHKKMLKRTRWQRRAAGK